MRLLIILLFISFNCNAQIFQFLDTIGDGTGRINHNGNYSSSPDTVFIENTSSRLLEISRMIVTIQDANGMIAGEYGNLNTTLTNDITFKVLNSSGDMILDVTKSYPIRYNAAWAEYCYDTDLKGWVTGEDILVSRWSFFLTGSPLKLYPGEKFIGILNDDFTGLTEHHFQMQGRYTDKRY